jgi:hypothetical protein
MSAQVRERAARSEVRQSGVTRMPLGLNIGETVAIVIAILLLGWVLTQYLTSLRPEQERLRTVEAQLAQQQRDIVNGRPTGSDQGFTEDQGAKALESLESFKGNHLKAFSAGRIALIKEINALAKKNSVTLTSGIDMGSNPADTGNEADQSSDKKNVTRRRKSDDLLKAFPSVNFRFTVFGQYANIRTFINEVEHEKQFVVINAVSLTNQEAKVSARRRGGEGTAGIMLQIEMAAYFQPS